jgi:hypothetical protein
MRWEGKGRGKGKGKGKEGEREEGKGGEVLALDPCASLPWPASL